MSYTEKDALATAVLAARDSPCAKSKRGVVIWNELGPAVMSCNHLPLPLKCDGSDACRASCGKTCVHAEQDALVRFQGGELSDFEMLHVKIKDGNAVPSGPPSCWQCSKLILLSGLKAMWLLENRVGVIRHHSYLHRYTPLEFHQLTLNYHALHGTE